MMKQLLAAGVVLLGLAGTAAAQYPPPLYQEMVPVAPGPRWIWQPGHWQWNGYQYVWVRGHYVPVRPHYRRWVHGHWAPGPGGWVWVPGGWQ